MEKRPSDASLSQDRAEEELILARVNADSGARVTLDDALALFGLTREMLEKGTDDFSE